MRCFFPNIVTTLHTAKYIHCNNDDDNNNAADIFLHAYKSTNTPANILNSAMVKVSKISRDLTKYHNQLCSFGFAAMVTVSGDYKRLGGDSVMPTSAYSRLDKAYHLTK